MNRQEFVSNLEKNVKNIDEVIKELNSLIEEKLSDITKICNNVHNDLKSVDESEQFKKYVEDYLYADSIEEDKQIKVSDILKINEIDQIYSGLEDTIEYIKNSIDEDLEHDKTKKTSRLIKNKEDN